MFEVRLAPMCGITDHIYRTLCYELGCDLAYTEMISAMGYLCAPGQRATQELMVRGKDEPRLVLQLFGRDPDTVAEAAKWICDLGRYDGIDLNMGCPAKKIAPSGEGCGLMRTPDAARKMMEKTVAASNVPVSVKMRLGYDAEHINVIEFARMAEEAGIASVTVHGRTREQQYGGTADWEMIAKVKDSVTIPVCGRGAMGNPWLFREIKAAMNGQTVPAVSNEEKHRLVLRHYRMMLETRPEPIAVREMRKHVGWYIKGMKGAGRFRAEINRCDAAGTAMEMISGFFEQQNAENETGREDVTG